MKTTEAHARLLAMDQPAFTTGDAAVCLGISNAHASKTLARLAEVGHLVSLRRGLWAVPDRMNKLALPAYLTAPFPSYVSLQSALYYHGMISQIPSAVYAVSLARTKRWRTALGDVSIHHVSPSFYFGYDHLPKQGVWMAKPEKALLDVAYLSAARTRLFAALPEIELPASFSQRRIQAMLKKIRPLRWQEMAGRRLREWGIIQPAKEAK